jgi:hypothetical protein
VAYAREKAERRGTTPFAYATPHSNAPYYWEGRAASAGSGDTDASGDGGGDIYDEFGLMNEEAGEVGVDVYDSNSDGDGDGQIGRNNESWEGVTDEDSGAHVPASTHDSNSSAGHVESNDDDAESDTEARALSPSLASENNEDGTAGVVDSDDENQPPSEYDSTLPVPRFVGTPATKAMVPVKQERRSGEWEVYVDEDADVE